MRRLAPTLLVLVLLGATAAAFAVAERLKLQKSPISGTRVDPVFSPICRCPTDVARIHFRLATSDRLTLAIVDANGHRVRTLVDNRPTRGRRRYTWNGRDDEGRVVPEGPYRARVQLDDLGRTIVLPNPIVVDTTPPRIIGGKVEPLVFSPDGDGRADRIVVRYRVGEPAAAMLIVNDTRRVLGRLHSGAGGLRWYGKVDGRSLRAGAYRIQLAAVDRAGNVSEPVRAGIVRIRYVELPRQRFRVRPLARFRVPVDTDAKRVKWRLGSRRGTGPARALVVVAPRKPGSYVLRVSVRGHSAQAKVLVTAG